MFCWSVTQKPNPGYIHPHPPTKTRWLWRSLFASLSPCGIFLQRPSVMRRPANNKIFYRIPLKTRTSLWVQRSRARKTAVYGQIHKGARREVSQVSACLRLGERGWRRKYGKERLLVVLGKELFRKFRLPKESALKTGYPVVSEEIQIGITLDTKLE